MSQVSRLLFGVVIIGTASTIHGLGMRNMGAGLLRWAAIRLPEQRHIFISHLAHLYERQNCFAGAFRVLDQLGPPESERAFYFVELANLLEKQEKYADAAQFYEIALQHESEFGPAFVEWLRDRLATMNTRSLLG